MRILTLHSDFIEFEAKKKAIKEPEELKNKQERIEECLVVFISVENKDESDPASAAANLVKNIKEIAAMVNEKKVVLYPYVHLSSSPSSPATALKVLDLAESGLKGEYEVHRSPFGWYKSFNISVKGHPLSELSREFGPEKEEAKPGEAKEADIGVVGGKSHAVLYKKGEIAGKVEKEKITDTILKEIENA